MFDFVPFSHQEGSVKHKKLILFSLTTCGFCKRARAYLDSEGWEYDIFFADEMDAKDKKKLKEEFKEHFGATMHFPALIIDEKDFLVGFIRPDWELVLKEETHD